MSQTPDNRMDWMQQAGELTRQGRLAQATAMLQRALLGDIPAPVPAPAPAPATASASASASATAAAGLPKIINLPGPAVAPLTRAPAGRAAARAAAERFASPTARQAPHVQPGARLLSGSVSHGGRHMDYQLLVPPGQTQGANPKLRPLVVMLHGCTQQPEDFARGTGMSQLAAEQGFYVLYPEQNANANPQRCWNWFKHNHQQRGSGEPALIAAATLAVLAQQPIDPHRVYIAGLSAGGAMADIVASAYPDIFAAVGVHSGLPSGAASSVAEALSAMRSGTSKAAAHNGAMPTIVFHGDQDSTVHPLNGEQVVARALQKRRAAGAQVQQGQCARGRRYTRTTHAGPDGMAQAEHWLVHGAGHAWQGGDSAGSYTDAQGPDASAEMLRFFFERRRP